MGFPRLSALSPPGLPAGWGGRGAQLYHTPAQPLQLTDIPEQMQQADISEHDPGTRCLVPTLQQPARSLGFPTVQRGQ